MCVWCRHSAQETCEQCWDVGPRDAREQGGRQPGHNQDTVSAKGYKAIETYHTETPLSGTSPKPV